MPNPATFTPLEVTGYTPEWDNGFEVPEGVHFEHARFHLDNGYVVSIVRTTLEPGSAGVENGNWEAALTKPNTDMLTTLLTGMVHAPATELDDLNTEDVDGFRIVSNLDNAGIQALLDEVVTRPPASPVTPEEADDLLQKVMGSLADFFGEGDFEETDSE